MIKFILKLAVVVLLANAAWHVGSTYLNHYRFEDKVMEKVQYRARKTDEELRKQIVELASQFDVPISEDDVTVQRQQTHTIVDGSYDEDIDLLPGYSRTFSFTLHLDVPTATLP